MSCTQENEGLEEKDYSKTELHNYHRLCNLEQRIIHSAKSLSEALPAWQSTTKKTIIK